MATKKTERGRPAVQPPDEELDFSDIPEVTDYSNAVRGTYYERATGKPLPAAVRRLNKAEAEVRRLREALGELYAYTTELEGRMAPFLATRPGMTSLPLTQAERDALGQRIREALGQAERPESRKRQEA